MLDFEVFKGCLHYTGMKGTAIAYRNPDCPIASTPEDDYNSFRATLLRRRVWIESYQKVHCEMKMITITHENSLKWLKRVLKVDEDIENKKILLIMKEKEEVGNQNSTEVYKLAIHDLATNKILLRTCFHTIHGGRWNPAMFPVNRDKIVNTRKSSKNWFLGGKKKSGRLSTLTADKKFWMALAYRIE